MRMQKRGSKAIMKRQDGHNAVACGELEILHDGLRVRNDVSVRYHDSARSSRRARSEHQSSQSIGLDISGLQVRNLKLCPKLRKADEIFTTRKLAISDPVNM